MGGILLDFYDVLALDIFIVFVLMSELGRIVGHDNFGGAFELS